MITPRRRQAAVAVVVAALTFGLAACGPSTGSATRSPTTSAHWFAINGVPLADLIDQLNATSGDFLSKDEPDAIATCQRASYDITLLDGGLTDVAPTGDTRLFADLEFALAALAPGISACERGGLDAKVVSPEGDALFVIKDAVPLLQAVWNGLSSGAPTVTIPAPTTTTSTATTTAAPAAGFKATGTGSANDITRPLQQAHWAQFEGLEVSEVALRLELSR